MSEFLNNTVIRIKEQGTNRRREIGKVNGYTFRSFERDPSKHLFRGGAESVEEALESGRAAWGLDLGAMEKLAEFHGVKFVEIPVPDGVWRVSIGMLLGPKSYIKEYGGHRPQVMLPTHYWTKQENRHE